METNNLFCFTFTQLDTYSGCQYHKIIYNFTAKSYFNSANKLFKLIDVINSNNQLCCGFAVFFCLNAQFFQVPWTKLAADKIRKNGTRMHSLMC